jgi:hypothetical protein
MSQLSAPLLAVSLAIASIQAQTIDSKARVDFWEDIGLFGTAQADTRIDAPRKKIGVQGVARDHADKKCGDWSFRYAPAAKAGPRFGFVAGPRGKTWSLKPEATLEMWVKIEAKNPATPWNVILVDAAGKQALGTMDVARASGEWQEISLPLRSLNPEPGFQWGSIRLMEFESELGEGSTVWLDGAGFLADGRLTAVTDMPVGQRIAEADASRQVRVVAACKSQSEKTDAGLAAFAKFYLNEDLGKANELMASHLQNIPPDSYWSLFETPFLCRFYYLFSNRCGKFPGRMKPEVEKLLLEKLWERTYIKNDIFWARQSTWWLDGSENHDLNSKACNLVSSRIFMNEPDYRNRVYPDYGFGGAYHYGRPGYYGPGIDPESRHGGGRASLSDGRKYTAKDHYAAWLAFMKTYFRERARRGFFLENYSSTYSKHTLGFAELAYGYGGDAELQRIVGNFLTLYWADWAQAEISGARGGPKARFTTAAGECSANGVVSYLLGGAGNIGYWGYWNLVTEYRLPPLVWRMALDRQGMGCFVSLSRGIGEEENIWPRPLGAERTMLIDTESRFLKYIYVTPDYMLGTQMDHPAAVHSHLSAAGRWQGMTFAQSSASRIVPVELNEVEQAAGGGDASTKGGKKKEPHSATALFRTVQHRQTLILQQARTWLDVNPEWYAHESRYDRPVGIYVGTGWDRLEEKQGWIFLQSGNAYAAVRPVLRDAAAEAARKMENTGNQANFVSPKEMPTATLRSDSYKWSLDRSYFALEDRFSPVIVEAGRHADYPTLDAFMADVLDNPLRLYKTVVPWSHILVYTGCGKDAPEIVFSAGTNEIPTVGGKYVDYAYPMTFESPYMRSAYKSGKVELQFGGERLSLDFTGTASHGNKL